MPEAFIAHALPASAKETYVKNVLKAAPVIPHLGMKRIFNNMFKRAEPIVEKAINAVLFNTVSS